MRNKYRAAYDFGGRGQFCFSVQLGTISRKKSKASQGARAARHLFGEISGHFYDMEKLRFVDFVPFAVLVVWTVISFFVGVLVGKVFKIVKK